MENKKQRGPKSKLGAVLQSLLITAVVGFIYFYVSLPALNLQDSNFYVFVFVLCLVFVISALFTTGFHMDPGGGLKEYFRFIKSQCLPVGILMAALILVGVVGSVISMPLFRASAYRQLLQVEEGDFSTDVKEISFNEIPLLDEDSARYLSTTQMGTIPDWPASLRWPTTPPRSTIRVVPSVWPPWNTPILFGGSPTAPTVCPLTLWWIWSPRRSRWFAFPMARESNTPLPSL